MRQLGMPTLFCHRLIVENDRITDFELRQVDQKRHAVEAFRSLNYRIVAAGDSYNDTAMLAAADAGYLFHAPDNVIKEFPQFRAINDFKTLLTAISESLN
jgi:phosphoserine/homoserine phosphotransferase